jgi:hypothetical protein
MPTNATGYLKLLAWARSLGCVRRAGVEGTGTFGAGLARVLREQGIAPRRKRSRNIRITLERIPNGYTCHIRIGRCLSAADPIESHPRGHVAMFNQGNNMMRL